MELITGQHTPLSGCVLQSWRGYFNAGEKVSPEGSSIDFTLPISGHRSIRLVCKSAITELSGTTQYLSQGKLFNAVFDSELRPGETTQLAMWHLCEVNDCQEVWVTDKTNQRSYHLQVSVGQGYIHNYFNLLETRFPL